jgi:ADP-heptose:LPS heptosyltransferase
MNAYIVNFGGVGNGIMTMPIFQHLISNKIYDKIFCSENRVITNSTLTRLAQVHNQLEAVNSSWRRFEKNNWDNMHNFLQIHDIAHIYNFRNENLELYEEFKKRYPEYSYFDLDFETLRQRKAQRAVHVDIFNLFKGHQFDNNKNTCEWLSSFRAPYPETVTIGFMVSASQQNKELPLEQWITLGTKLLAKYPLLRISIFSGIKDHELSFAEAVVGEIRDTRCTFVGKLNLIETIEKMGELHCFVSNDTGLLHICGALGLPAVGLYTSTDPDIWKPNTFAHFISVTHPSIGTCEIWKPYAGTCGHFYETCNATNSGKIDDHAIIESVECIIDYDNVRM